MNGIMLAMIKDGQATFTESSGFKMFLMLPHEKRQNGRYRLLLCDGYDNHISAQFVRFCIDNKIVLFLLPPHSSHLLQPLDVGVFGPVKAVMSLLLNKLNATEI
jgi:hypothetical protein